MSKTLYNTSTENSKPSLNYREILRSRKLHLARQNIKSYMDHVGSSVNHERFITQVVLLVAEIAVLDRAGPADNHEEYIRLIDATINVDPWDIMAAWNEHAMPHITRASSAWAEHVAQAQLKSEPKKFKHQKFVDLDFISEMLFLDRGLIRIIFDEEKCAFNPIKVQASRFDADTRKRLRELAEITTISAERLGDILLERGQAGLQAHVDEKIVEAAERFERLKDRKPGPKPRADTKTNEVKQLARQLRVNPSTVWRHMAAQEEAKNPVSTATMEVDTGDQIVTISLPVTVNSPPEFRVFETPENVTLRVNSCNVESEFSLGDSGISTLFSSSTHTVESFHDESMDRLAETAMTYKKKKRQKYQDKDVMREWYLATTGKVLTDENLRVWTFRKKYRERQLMALSWKALNKTATINEADRKVIRIVSKELAA